MNGFLQDSAGDRSSTRLLMVAGVAFILGVWGITSIKSGAPQPMPMEIVGIVIALVTGKVGTDAVNVGGLFKKKEDQP